MESIRGVLRIGQPNNAKAMAPFHNKSFCYHLLITLIVTILTHFPSETDSLFSSKFVWSAINKTLDEDRLAIVDANNEKVKIKSCTKLVLFNTMTEGYIKGNDSGNAIFVNISGGNFSTDERVAEVREGMDAINPGACVPCIVVISIVNVSSMQEERKYGLRTPDDKLLLEHWGNEETMFDDYKFGLSQQLLKLLQYKTPIQARHLVLVRLTERKDELTKCHGKKYTKYPRRLVSLWEQILFDHFKEARVIQGTIEEGTSEHTLATGKETGIWVWMCEEISRRLELQERCKKGRSAVLTEEKCQLLESTGNFSTRAVDMTDRNTCRVYRPRS